MKKKLSHLGPKGEAHMVDVSGKAVTSREAVASGRIAVSKGAMQLVGRGRLPKGGVVEVARIAGILAAKKTAETIPLCHPLPLSYVDVAIQPTSRGFSIEACVRTSSQTGAEMEALHAVAVAALTLYDMLKALDPRMVITDVHLVRKSGGRSGLYEAP